MPEFTVIDSPVIDYTARALLGQLEVPDTEQVQRRRYLSDFNFDEE